MGNQLCLALLLTASVWKTLPRQAGPGMGQDKAEAQDLLPAGHSSLCVRKGVAQPVQQGQAFSVLMLFEAGKEQSAFSSQCWHWGVSASSSTGAEEGAARRCP